MKTRINKSVKLILLMVAFLTIGLSFALHEKPVHAYGSSAPDPSLTNAPAFTGITAEGNCRQCHNHH